MEFNKGDRNEVLSFVADLEKLEKEFELHLKQLDESGGLVPSTPTDARSQLTSAKSQRRYRAGTPGNSPKKILTDNADEALLLEDRQFSDLLDKLTKTTLNIQKSVDNISSAVESTRSTHTESQNNIGKDLNKLSQDVIKETYKVVKAVKEKLTDGKWVRNKDFLAQTLRKLEKSADLIDYAKNSSSLEPVLPQSVFDFGLIRSGTQSDLLVLFDLSNDGNMMFPFVVVADPSDVLFPVETSRAQELWESPFKVLPTYGEVAPGTVITLKSTFISYECGLYRQKYNVLSEDDLIRHFVLKGRIGTPILEVDRTSIDFGLVNRHTECKVLLTISNVGTYKDSWKCDASSNISFDESNAAVQVFSVSTSEGSLEPGEKKIISVVFHPPKEGNFNSSLRISWLKTPIVIPVCGLGGGSKFQFRFESTQDEMYNGLDWGTCIIGNNYDKTLHIENIGNIEGFADIVYSKFFKFEFERNEKGLLPIMNGESKMVKITFEPSQIGNFKDLIQVTQINGSPLPLPFKFKAGTCSWKLDGDLTFLNMKYYTREEKKLIISNNGSLDIPISYKFTVTNNSTRFYELTFKPNWLSGKLLKPGEVLEINLAMIPEEITSYEGSLQLTTQLAKGPIMEEFPFKFQAFKDEIALEDDSDISVGRIMMGTSKEVTRAIKNYGNKEVDWRISIQLIPLSNGNTYNIWSVVGESGT